jgi:hypothetical protein
MEFSAKTLERVQVTTKEIYLIQWQLNENPRKNAMATASIYPLKVKPWKTSAGSTHS